MEFTDRLAFKMKQIGKTKMNRSLSAPCDDPSATSEEEVKTLYTDPALLNREENDGKNSRSRHSSNISSLHPTIVPIGEDVKIQDPLFATAGNSLMTRRITIAGGFLDIALFTANCEQLKFVLELGYFHIYYRQVVGLLIASLVLQLLVGFTMFLLGCQISTQKASDETYANFLNHATMGLVALITIVNIFIGTFGPKGTVMARCLGAFAFPDNSGPLWKSYLNFTRSYMAGEVVL